jgi:hypothetical protein
MRKVIGISCTVSSCWPRAWRIVSSPWSEYISKQILSSECLIVATSLPFYVLLVRMLSTCCADYVPGIWKGSGFVNVPTILCDCHFFSHLMLISLFVQQSHS